MRKAQMRTRRKNVEWPAWDLSRPKATSSRTGLILACTGADRGYKNWPWTEVSFGGPSAGHIAIGAAKAHIHGGQRHSRQRCEASNLKGGTEKKMTMRRRDLVLSACAVVMHLFGSAHAWSEEAELGGRSKGTKPAKADDSNIFQDLANLFKEMRTILDPVADVETKRKFGVAFQGINENLKHIIQAQDEIFRALEQDPCSASGGKQGDEVGELAGFPAYDTCPQTQRAGA